MSDPTPLKTNSPAGAVKDKSQHKARPAQGRAVANRKTQRRHPARRHCASAWRWHTRALRAGVVFVALGATTAVLPAPGLSPARPPTPMLCLVGLLRVCECAASGATCGG